MYLFINTLKYYDLGSSEVFVFKNYLVNQIKEGEILVVEHAQTLRAMIDKHFIEGLYNK
ncbi:hypothetical protein P700755_001233 [Psychroflexus torquis ATCC 700755]|uniref:Uncharacterized protein n=1 Tax=Psychroflexus torquis (strain ATCC 700755 / CIP 106069 / ACAM 623) TaxID=313595 RepID=K4IRS3_PSYTT|nr:hypothetical protein P700755_001233 [Psychroflexus torquis ATCC 700755]